MLDSASMAIALFDGMLLQFAMDPDAFDIDEYAAAMLEWIGLPAE